MKYSCPTCLGQKTVEVSYGSVDLRGFTQGPTQVVECGGCGGTGRECYMLQDYRGMPIERIDRERYEAQKQAS